MYRKSTDLDHPCRRSGVDYLLCLKRNFRAVIDERRVGVHLDYWCWFFMVFSGSYSRNMFFSCLCDFSLRLLDVPVM